MEFERFNYPEEAGIPSSALIRFHKLIARSGRCLHGFMVLRYGKIVHEAYWDPIDENFRHRLYSASKSITSLAIGKLVTEGKITVNDKIADYFPDFAAMNPSPLLMKAKIRDLLMMATMNFMIDRDEDKEQRWIEDFFTREANHMPGAFFDYN
ncbi:MAG: serine hydrolase, partial [Ruminococcaceae bacterium]|nr:serine hydrolase [Oscillospiraceae bacterium]